MLVVELLLLLLLLLRFFVSAGRVRSRPSGAASWCRLHLVLRAHGRVAHGHPYLDMLSVDGHLLRLPEHGCPVRGLHGRLSVRPRRHATRTPRNHTRRVVMHPVGVSLQPGGQAARTRSTRGVRLDR